MNAAMPYLQGMLASMKRHHRQYALELGETAFGIASRGMISKGQRRVRKASTARRFQGHDCLLQMVSLRAKFSQHLGSVHLIRAQ